MKSKNEIPKADSLLDDSKGHDQTLDPSDIEDIDTQMLKAASIIQRTWRQSITKLACKLQALKRCIISSVNQSAIKIQKTFKGKFNAEPDRIPNKD